MLSETWTFLNQDLPELLVGYLATPLDLFKFGLLPTPAPGVTYKAVTELLNWRTVSRMERLSASGASIPRGDIGRAYWI